MAGNATSRFHTAALLSVARVMPSRVSTSAEIEARLGPALDRVRLKAPLLSRVAGILERRAWAPHEEVGAATIEAGARALQEAGVSADQVDLLINTSVTRKHLEPSVAVRIHHGLGLSSAALNFDLANACLGFVNAMSLAAGMIDAGQARYALIVNGEDADEMRETTISRLLRSHTEREAFMSEFASLTLGSGSAAAVIGPGDVHPTGHRILGGVTRAATQFHDLCVGGADGIFTDARNLLLGGLDLVLSAWKEALGEWDWATIDRYITHQVSKAHTEAIIEAAGLDAARVPVTFPTFGNVGPASIPITLVEEMASLSPGDRVLLMGVGSGINTAMLEITW